MKRLVTLLLLLVSLEAYPLDVRIVPNTPLFEDHSCHKYEGKEAVRAVLQLLASARMSIDLDTHSLANEAVRTVVLQKAGYGTTVNLYSQNESTFRDIPASSNVNRYVRSGDKFKSATIIRIDNTFVGMGNVDLENAIKVRSMFFVCRSSTTSDTKVQMEGAFGRIIKDSTPLKRISY